MANDNWTTRSVCYSDMEQLARDTPTKTNRWVFHPGRSNRFIPGCAYHCCNGSDSIDKKGGKKLMGVTKTDFMRGMQCPKMLWLDAHKREERIIPPEVQARLDKGNEFGDGAMGLFGPYVEVTTYKENGWLDYTAMIEKTKECLEDGTAVICEGSFSNYGNYCAVDILRKVDGGYEMYEVKDSPTVQEQFIKDIAFQRYLALRCGVKIIKCFIIYHGSNEEQPYEIEEVTAKAKEYSRWVDENIWRLAKLKKQDEEPQVDMGNQCNEPYECWYCTYCKK